MQRGGARLRFGRIEEDEGVRQKKKYDDTLKQKKDVLKQEFEHLEEMRKFDEQSVKSLNEVKFKNEFDRVFNVKKQRQQVHEKLESQLQGILMQNRQHEDGNNQNQTFSSSQGFRSMVNNHHSDQLYSKYSKNLLAKKPDDLKSYITELQGEDKRYQGLVEMEQEKSLSLKKAYDEILRSKIKFQQEIEEYRVLNRVADSRFSNIESLNFLAVEKQKISKKNLNSIRSELKEMDDMRTDFRKTQNDKQREYKKEIYVGEEYVSHNGMKIEEAEQRIIEQEKDIQQLEHDEKRIFDKRQKSQNLLWYIEAFETFEKIFMNRIPDEEVVRVPHTQPRLVDYYDIDQELLEDFVNQNPIFFNPQLEIDSLSSSPRGDQPVDFDRNQLINYINQFFLEHPQGSQPILKFMIEKLWQLKSDTQKNTTSYENILKEKTMNKHLYEMMEQELEHLIENNQYIQQNELQDGQQMRQLPKKSQVEIISYESVIDNNAEVAFDAGLFVSHLTRGSEEAQVRTTTLNIVKLEMDTLNENEQLTDKTKKCQNLLFNFFLSLTELLHRSGQILQDISENSFKMTSLDIDQHVQMIFSFIESIWSKSQHSQRRKNTKSTKVQNNNLKQSFSLTGSAMAALNQQPSLDSEVISEQISNLDTGLNLNQVKTIFREVFLTQISGPSSFLSVKPVAVQVQASTDQDLQKIVDQASEYFFVQTKQDQLAWILLSPTILKRFLNQIKQTNKEYFKQGNFSRMTVNVLLPAYQLSTLRHELFLIFSQNFHTLLNYCQTLQIKLKELSSELKIYLKEKDPKFDPKKLNNIIVREGFTIKEARQNISMKFEQYRTGEQPKKVQQSDKQSVLSKVFQGKNANSESVKDDMGSILVKGLAKLVQPEIAAQQEVFLIEDKKEKLNEEDLLHMKKFFRSKLEHKYEPTVSILKKKKEDEKSNVKNQKSQLSEKDQFDEERDQIKDDILTDWAKVLEVRNKKGALPQDLESLNEKKAQIKEVTERLYGERGEAAITLKSMSMTTGILSDIDRLEKQPSPIEQPFLISNFKLQKKAMHRNLNNELSLPSLQYLKPTSAYFSRRQQSQEQLKVLAQKKYDLIESGMAPTNATSTYGRPATETNQTRKLKSNQQDRTKTTNQFQLKDQNANVEKFYERYGSLQTSEQFLGYLMNRNGTPTSQITLQEFPFQFNKRAITKQDAYQRSGGEGRPKSILVYPSQ